MLDMAFWPDVRRILRHIPARRQTFFFSATMPPPIVALTREMLQRSRGINIGRKGGAGGGCEAHDLPGGAGAEASAVSRVARGPQIDRALIFTRTRHRADRLAAFLQRSGVPVGLIHGDRSQGQRTAALAGFKQGKIRVLVATDIARAASTSKNCRTSSTSTSRISPRITSIAWAARRGSSAPATRSPSSRQPKSRACG